MSVRSRSGDARDDVVVTALHRLAPHLDGEPDPAFRAATRARLVAMAAVRSPEPARVTGVKRLLAARADDATPPRWRRRLTGGLAAAALTVTAAASLLAIASGAGPGDALYGLKRGTEETQLALAGDARGQILLDLAGTRLRELRSMVGDPATDVPAAGSNSGVGGTVLAGGADPELVISTLQTMDDQTTEGTARLGDRAVTTRDGAPLEHLSLWTNTQSAGLTELAPELPDAAGAAVSHSLALLSHVSARADGLQLSLTCPSAPAVGPADALGPVPAVCAPDAPATSGDPAGTAVPGTGSATGGVAPTPAAPTAPAGDTGTNGTTTGGTGTGRAGGSGSGGGSAGVPVPGAPTVPGLPSLPLPSGLPSSVGVPRITLPGTTATVPSVGVPLPRTDVTVPGTLPRAGVPLPRTGVTPPGAGSEPAVDVPATGLPAVCLPPPATIGDC